MSKVSAWLVQHGLGKYTDSFESNDISFDLFSELNQDDLRELGLSLGHQKKFLKLNRIAADSSTLNVKDPYLDAEQTSASERRQLTVMFCDLADSTAIVNRIGAEDMQEIYRDYQNICTQAVQRYNGYIAKFLGDGVLVYFGYPQAHELDADRSIRAGLDLIEMIKELDAKYQATIGVQVAVRIGIATGSVVVGDIIGEGEARQYSVVGETPNLAARIQSLAPLNSVTVSELTRRLASPGINFADYGLHNAKGFSKPIHIWTAVSGRNIDSRFRASLQRSQGELVGREKELHNLLNCWQATANGAGQLVYICGEAGIGKSHLIEAFLEKSGCAEEHCMRFQCSPYHTGTILFPVLEQIQRELNAGSDTQRPLCYEDLLTYFGNANNFHQEAADYFGSLLSVHIGENHSDEDTTAQARQQRAFTGWIHKLVEHTHHAPLIIVLEDAHWLDATSIGLISQLVSNLHLHPILLIVASRPDFINPWKHSRCDSTEIALSKMNRQQGLAVINRVAADIDLPDQVRELILNKTDGVPLFLEELTKSVIEHAQQNDDGAIDDLDAMITAIDIPESLNDLLMSRLDKEPSVKGVAQIGAAIGRDFAYELLASVAPHEEKELKELLTAVVNSELVFESGPLPSAVYTFRHALLQDAAYRSLLKKNRKLLHAEIAKALESANNDSTSAESIAHHWALAEQPAKALAYWHQAAREAAAIWANAEAIIRYKRALTCLQQLPDAERTTEQEIKLLLELGHALRAVNGSSARETIEVFTRATELCKPLKNIDLIVRSYYGYFATHFTAANLDEAQSGASRLLGLSRARKHPIGTAAGHQAIGMHAFATGNLTAAKEQLELALSFKEKFDFEFDLQYPVLSQSYLSWTLYFLGQKNEAREMIVQAIAEAESVSAYNHALVMANACYLLQFEDDVAELETLSRRLKILSDAKGFPVWYAVADFFDCWQLCRRDGNNTHINKLLSALEFWSEDEIETPYFKAIVAELLLRNDHLAEGERLAQEAQALMHDTGEIWYQAQLNATVDRHAQQQNKTQTDSHSSS